MTEITTKALLRHSWDLSDELIAFTFFDERIDSNTKARMVEAMRTKQGLQIPRRVYKPLEVLGHYEIKTL